jgi:hypothetical protein
VSEIFRARIWKADLHCFVVKSPKGFVVSLRGRCILQPLSATLLSGGHRLPVLLDCFGVFGACEVSQERVGSGVTPDRSNPTWPRPSDIPALA